MTIPDGKPVVRNRSSIDYRANPHLHRDTAAVPKAREEQIVFRAALAACRAPSTPSPANFGESAPGEHMVSEPEGTRATLGDSEARLSALLSTHLIPERVALPPSSQGPHRAVWPQEVADRILRVLQIGRTHDRFDLRFELARGLLGDLSVQLTERAGRLALRFESSSPHVLSKLNSAMTSVAASLSARGIRFESIAATLRPVRRTPPAPSRRH